MKHWGWYAVAGAVLVFGAGSAMLGMASLVVVTAVLATHDTAVPVEASAPLEELAVAEASPIPTPVKHPPASTGVVVNGRALTHRQLAALSAQYGQTAGPGRYWYDARSGMYGLQGEPPAGRIQPGLDFGPLSVNASAGTSSVRINGRRLPVAELAYYESLLGPIRPGRYWVDGAGNAGLEGSAVPLIRGNGGWNGQWSGRISSGTVDRSGGGNSVFAVDGEVLTLP